MSERLADAAQGLPRAMFVFNQRETDKAIAVGTEADAGRDRDLGFAEQELGKFERAHRAEGFGNRGPDEHRGVRFRDRPARAIEAIYEYIAAAAIGIDDFGDAILRAVERRDAAT